MSFIEKENKRFANEILKKFQVGLLVKLNDLPITPGNSMLYSFHKENPTHHSNPPVITYQIDKYDAFTVIETDAFIQECRNKNNDIFLKYVLLLRVLQYDKIGWMKLIWTSLNTAAILKAINNKITIIS